MLKKTALYSLCALAVVLAMACASMEPHRMSLINYDAMSKVSTSTATLSVTPTLINDGDRVYVSYHLDDRPANHEDVFIAAYSPSTVDVKKTAPIAYKFLLDSYGKTAFDLVNMRDDYVFVVFSGGLAAPVELSRSNYVTFQNYNAPRGARLMHTQNPSEMMVSWSSKTSDLHPRVNLWPCADEAGKTTVQAVSKTWSKSDFCGSPATGKGYRDPGYVHSAVLSELQAGVQYCYEFGSDDEMAAVHKFTQPGNTYPFSAVAYGDEGQGSSDGSTLEEDFPNAVGTAALTKELIEQDPSTHLVIHFGDISYARGYAADWDIYMHMNRDVLSVVPYAASVGNHEADYPNSTTYQNGTDSGGECGIAVQMQFPTPQPALNKPWYWFKSGPLFVVMMSTEHDFRKGSEQYSYLEDVLSHIVNRDETPWVVFTGHRPMYIDSTNDNPGSGDLTVAVELQKEIEPLLLNAGGKPVDITLWGHHHSYQRMCASYAGECQQRSEKSRDGVPTYNSPAYPIALVVGTAGPNPSMNIQIPQPAYTEVVSFEHGAAHITVHNETSMHWRFLKNGNSKVLDEFWLHK